MQLAFTTPSVYQQLVTDTHYECGCYGTIRLVDIVLSLDLILDWLVFVSNGQNATSSPQGDTVNLLCLNWLAAAQCGEVTALTWSTIVLNGRQCKYQQMVVTPFLNHIFIWVRARRLVLLQHNYHILCPPTHDDALPGA